MAEQGLPAAEHAYCVANHGFSREVHAYLAENWRECTAMAEQEFLAAEHG